MRSVHLANLSNAVEHDFVQQSTFSQFGSLPTNLFDLIILAVIDEWPGHQFIMITAGVIRLNRFDSNEPN